MISGAALKRLSLWLLQTAVFLLIPGLLFHAGLRHIDQLRYNDGLIAVEQKIEETLASFATHAATEEFMAQTFYRAFYEMLRGNPVAVIRNYHKRLDAGFDYMLWAPSNRLLDSTVDPESFSGDWKMGLRSINDLFTKKAKDFEPSNEEIDNARRLFGPQVIFSSMTGCLSQKNRRLLAFDSSRQSPLCWIGSFKGLTLVILVKPEIVKGASKGLDYYMNYLHDNSASYILGFVRNDKVKASGEIPDKDFATRILEQHSLKNGVKFATPQAHFFLRIVGEDLTLFACVSKNKISAGKVNASFVWLMLLSAFLVSGLAELKVLSIRFSISRKLFLLFIYSSGLPLTMLFFVGYDYLNQKQYAMFDDLHAQGTHFLKNFDERFKSEEALRVFRIKDAIADLKESILTRGLTAASYKIFSEKLVQDIEDPTDLRQYMVASAADFIGTRDAVYLNGQRTSFLTEQLKQDSRKKRDDEAKAITTLIRFILANLNGDPSDSAAATEIEMLAESIMQKSLLEVQSEFLRANGQITLMGLAQRSNLAYIELMSLFSGNKYDFLQMTIWGPDILEDGYIKRQFLNANRNIPDLQLGIINEESDLYFPKSVVKNTVLRDYVGQFTHRPVPPRQFVTLDHQDYLIMGLRGKSLANFSLFALYPVSKIKDQIYREKSRLVTFGIVSLVLALILGQILSYSFLFPLRILAEGADAIRLRNFEARLPGLGRDEFGEMAEVFNTTMIDLEELKVAGAVQEHLLPKQLPEFANCSIHAQSFSLGDLGGDYYDCFTSNIGNLCLLTGDVSGHGVGAALIMAMAKAAIMKLEDLHNSPAELLLRMHRLIAATKQDQVKTMAFQFFNVDMQNLKACYTNAGSWPPLIIHPELQSVSEISLPGPRLGALKRPVFKSIEMSFSPGEALLLYTDGLIKARDMRGQMVGLDTFKRLAVQSYDVCPHKYFNNLMSAHRLMTGNNELQDDSTMIIVVFS
ncbi:MAG: SpoIIE family protein phosphatase [Candidatus Riflebacteria bacterium]|nr:SpoIIE family protein phosphatase [Candidatus Riflebacteria bacterium]